MAEKVKLLWASATVYTCCQCHCWIDRIPDFMGEPFDKGYECEQCGCTSVNLRPGRPFGPKSARWKDVLLDWDEYYEFILEIIEACGYWDIVKTEPPLVRPNIA